MAALRWLVGTGSVALALAGPIGAALTHASASNQEILVRYSGRLDTQWEPLMRQPDGRNFSVARYQWTLTWRGRINQLVQNPNQSLKVAVLKGTVKFVDNTSAENADCDGAFVTKVKKIPMTVSVNEPGRTITFMPRFPVSHEFLNPTNKTSLHEFCSEVAWWGLPDQYRLVQYELKIKGKGDSRSVNRSIPAQGVNRERSVLTETFSMKIAPRP